jgi:hypothetical protein
MLITQLLWPGSIKQFYFGSSNMTSKVEQYIQQSLWHSGFCVLDPEIAVDLSGLWDSVDEARAEFHNTEDLIRRFRKHYHVFEVSQRNGEYLKWMPFILRNDINIYNRVLELTGLKFPYSQMYLEPEQAEPVNDEDLL